MLDTRSIRQAERLTTVEAGHEERRGRDESDGLLGRARGDADADRVVQRVPVAVVLSALLRVLAASSHARHERLDVHVDVVEPQVGDHLVDNVQLSSSCGPPIFIGPSFDRGGQRPGVAELVHVAVEHRHEQVVEVLVDVRRLGRHSDSPHVRGCERQRTASN